VKIIAKLWKQPTKTKGRQKWFIGYTDEEGTPLDIGFDIEVRAEEEFMDLFEDILKQGINVSTSLSKETS